MVAETANQMGLVFFLLLLLTNSHSPPSEAFDYEAVLKRHDIALNEEALLKQLTPYDERAVKNLIAQLGHDEYESREAAQKALETLETPVLKHVRRARENNPDPEIVARCKSIEARLADETRSHTGNLLLGAVIRAVRERKSKSALPILTQLLTIGDRDVESAAADAIAAIGGKNVLKELKERLEAIPKDRESLRENHAVLRAYIGLAEGKELDVLLKFAGMLDRDTNLFLLRRCTDTAPDETWLRVLSLVSLAEFGILGSEGVLLPFADETLRRIYGIDKTKDVDWREVLRSPGLKPVLRGDELQEERRDFIAAMDGRLKLMAALGSTRNFPLDTASLGCANLARLRAHRNVITPDAFLADVPAVMRLRDVLRKGAGEHYTGKIFFVASESASETRGWWGIVAKGNYDSDMQAYFFGEVFMTKPERFADGFLINTSDKASIPFCCGFIGDAHCIVLFGPDRKAGVKNVLDQLSRRSGALAKNEKMYNLLAESKETVSGELWLLSLPVPGLSTFFKMDPLTIPFDGARSWRGSVAIAEDGSMAFSATADVDPDVADWRKAAKRMTRFFKRRAGMSEGKRARQEQLLHILWSMAADARVRFKDNKVTAFIKIDSKDLQKKAAEFMSKTFIPGILRIRRDYLLERKGNVAQAIQENRGRISRLQKRISALEGPPGPEVRGIDLSSEGRTARIACLKKAIERIRSTTYGGCLANDNPDEIGKELKAIEKTLGDR